MKEGDVIKIGMFDSGLGGLSVLHTALALNPHSEYMYYADIKNVPYGEKTREEVIRFADEATLFMVERGVEAVVIACNTATSCAIRFLREKYGIPFIGMEPAVKPAVELCDKLDKRVLVTATPLTVREEKLHSLIEKVDPHHISDTLALPELVRFAERFEFESDRVTEYLAKEFSRFDLSAYNAIVLGCTHFNYFKDTMASLLPSGIVFADGCEGTVRHLIDVIKKEGIYSLCESRVEYFFSGREITDSENKQILLLHDRLERMKAIQHS